LDKDQTNRQNGDIDKEPFGEDHEYRKAHVRKAPQVASRKAKGSIGVCGFNMATAPWPQEDEGS
jgi:hypothetical protein